MYLNSVHIKGIFICTVNCKDVHGTRKQMAPVIPIGGGKAERGTQEPQRLVIEAGMRRKECDRKKN